MKLTNEVWAIIPARSGSKGIKNKNIKIFNKKPLVNHSIISAKKNNMINKVVFSSDSKKYLSLTKKLNCEFYHLRSKKNAQDKSTDFQVFKEIVFYFKKKKVTLPKFLIHFRPTCPLRKNQSITKAIKLFKKKQNYFSSLKSVSYNSHNSLKDYIIKNKKLCSINGKTGYDIDQVNIPRGNLKKTYIGNGVIDIYKTKNIFKGKLLGKKVYPYVTEEIFCDIDNKRDFRFAETIVKTFRNKLWIS